MEAFPLRIQKWIQHLPPCSTVEHKCQPHYGRNWYEDSIHCHMLGVNSEYSQKSNPSNNAAKDEKEDDKRWETTCFFPFLFTCKIQQMVLTSQASRKSQSLQWQHIIRTWCSCFHAFCPYHPQPLHIQKEEKVLPCVSSVLNTRKSLVAKKPNSLSQASERVAIISAIEVSPPTLDSLL